MANQHTQKRMASSENSKENASGGEAPQKQVGESKKAKAGAGGKQEFKTIKTVGASRVLRLMDDEEDGESRYGEFVKLVAERLGIPIEQLDQELEPFI